MSTKDTRHISSVTRRLVLAVVHIFGKRNLLAISRRFSRATRWLAQQAHLLQFHIEWHVQPVPEWFDHYIDQYYGWSVRRNGYLLAERVVYTLAGLKRGGQLLDLCCGDGYASYHFYWSKAASIVAVDFDPDVIAYAKSNYEDPRITFDVLDIRKSVPAGPFDNVVWDAAIEHFTPEEIEAVITKIKHSLREGGLLNGHTVARLGGSKQLPQHEYEFESKEDLARFLTPHFNNVRVFESVYPERHALYFYASDGAVPFDDQWPAQTVTRR